MHLLLKNLLVTGVILGATQAHATSFNHGEAAAFQDTIRGGKMALSDSKWLAKKRAIYGKESALRPSKTLLGLAGKKPAASSIRVIGEAPDGFGQTVTWAAEDKELALIAFINPADPSGIMIRGVTRGTTIEIVSASGLASFSEDTKNEGIASFIGIAAAGAKIASGVFEAPYLVPLIQKAEKAAADYWKEEKVKSKVRDAYGQDPSSKHRAKQEGGIVFSLPNARGPVYSGKDRKYWIKESGIRKLKNYPDDIKSMVYFAERDGKPFRVTKDGTMYVLAWDHIFGDNLGFYKLEVILRRGNVPDPGNVD